MTTRLYFGTADDKFHVYDLDGATWTHRQTYTITAPMRVAQTTSNPGRLVADKTKIIFQVVEGVGQLSLDADGLITSDQLLTSAINPSWVSANPSGNRVLAKGIFSTPPLRLYDDSGTELDSFTPDSEADQCTFLTDTRAVLQVQSGKHQLIDIDGDTITSVAVSGSGYFRMCTIPVSATEYFSADTGTGKEVRLVDVSGDAFSITASASNTSIVPGHPGIVNRGKFLTQNVWEQSGSSFNIATSWGSVFYSSNYVHTAINDETRTVITSPANGWARAEVHLLGNDTAESTLTLTDEVRVAVSDFELESGPTTNEELFQASYADASAADPKVTALIRPADVQRSIDTDVSNLKDGPNLYTVEVIFDVGELADLNPYNSTTEKPRVFFVKDDQPGLRSGKNLLLKGYTIRDANPSVPVTCTFWG